jgi:pimeloyl-ACP methyl ester carboxylesterase
MDRFCRALAASGLIVVAPYLSDYLALSVRPGAADELSRALDLAEAVAARRGLAKPALFSISFGSMPAIEVAARAETRDRIGALVVFGGFAEFGAAVRFAVTGRYLHRGAPMRGLARDPLNTPAVFLNLLPHLDLDGADREAIAAAWRELVARTWGRPELKREGAREPTVRHVARRLSPGQRELFLVGAGLAPGGEALLERGLAAAGEAFVFTDPRPHLARVRAPVVLVHGRDDDVIPWPEAEKLRALLPAGHPCEVLVTGMAGHTGVGLPSPAALAGELVTLLRVARAIAGAPRALTSP